jgi:riboflavin kinase / FMN adenylyltransferase
MKVLPSLQAFQKRDRPVALTIGNFDGVHRGHLALIRRLKEVAQGLHGDDIVFSFNNHPVEVLRPGHHVARLCTPEHKIQLLQNAQVGTLVLATFDKAFAEQTPEQFMESLCSRCKLGALLLGHDAHIGKDRSGDRSVMEKLAAHHGVQLEYIPQLSVDGNPVSSSQIRALIGQGALDEASQLLGRPYSIYTTTRVGLGLGKKIGFPTLNMDVEGLCLPPLGVYAVLVRIEDTFLEGVANLGVAPTVRKDNRPLLEVHLLQYHEKIDLTQGLEVIFRAYIRPEMQFHSIADLQSQIAQDVQTARRILAEHSPLWTY